MIIQCEQCKTKFRLDDARVTDKGVKVRCAKCRNIFTVEKPKSESVPQADFASLLDQKNREDDSAFEDSAATTGAAEEAVDHSPQPSGTDSFSEDNPFADAAVPDAPAEPEESEPSVKAPQTVSETDDTAVAGFGLEADDPFEATAPETPTSEPVPAAGDDTNFAGFDFDSNDPFGDAAGTTPAAEETKPEAVPAAGDDTNFAGFDFDSNDPFGDAAGTTPAAEETKPEAVPAVGDDTNFAGFDFDSNDLFGDAATTTPATEKTKPEAVPAAVDDGFAGFDFDSNDPFGDVAATTPATEEAKPGAVPAAADDTNFAGFDFDSNNPFGDAAATTPVTEEARPGTVPAAAEDNFAGFDFGSSNPFEDQEKVAQGEPDFPTALPEPKSEADFSSFGLKTDLPGEEVTVLKEGIEKQEELSADQAAKTDDFFDFNELKAPQPEPFKITADEPGERGVAGSATAPVFKTPVAGNRPEQPAVEPKPSFEGIPAAPVVPQEELPPLSISSRRKQGSLITGAIAVIGVLGASAAAFFGYSYFAQDKVKSVADMEKISIRTVEASFVKNPLAGELLVISGEAQNNFKKPRAAIQIKGMVYGSGGQVVASKNAYAGNQLTREQLATMPLDKIEAAMANQFGDSLSNLGVPPAKTIPFVIVIPAPPADAKDYGVEAAGSTIATGKQ